MELMELLQDCPTDAIIGDNLVRAYSIINNPNYEKIMCSISGGSDSDIVLDICIKCDKSNKIDYVYFDTGLEYQATKDHLKYLENKYNIKIKIEKAIKPVPLTCKEYGQPFISKRTSLMVSGLQKRSFKFENKPLEQLLQEYDGGKSYIEWWCNCNKSMQYNIGNNKWLKEFMIQNPPMFKVSNKCCKYAKKDVANTVLINGKYDLNIVGVRKAEGGERASAYKSCFDERTGEYDKYRPIFWYLNDTKKVYEQHYKILHSECYTKYGLKRTGCAGCPFGKNFETELDIIKTYEPNLYKAVNNIFGDSYEYTRKYREFVKEMKQNNK